MPTPFSKLFAPTPFPQLRERLLRAGIAPRHVRRYLSELTDHLADLIAEEQSRGLPPTDARTAALARLGSLDTLADAMTAQPDLHSLAARAPWAVFSLTPIALLAGIWFLALCLLRLGWRFFLPGADTPFDSVGPHAFFDPLNLYFQLDRALYLGAPILAGWCMLLLAVRQRLIALWPILSLSILTLLAATSHVQASRLALPRGLGHILIDFALRPAPQNEYALGVLLLALAPYLLWTVRTRLNPNP